jgi:hypothetical protein
MASAAILHNRKNVTMIGVIHGDPETGGLLRDYLESLQPEALTLEFSRYGHDFRAATREMFREKVRCIAEELAGAGRTVNREVYDNLLSFMELPAEFSVASEYHRTHHVPFFLIDMDVFSSLRLRKADELFSRDNLELLLTEQTEKGSSHERVRARLYFENGVRTFPYTAEMKIRDRYMRDKISVLLHNYVNSRIVHICGWQHLADPDNLYASLNPTKVYIHDQTLCI